MELSNYINKLKPEVQNLFQKEFSGHDITHLERVMTTALHLQKIEGGDEIVVGISAFLHDVHRIMQKQTGKFVSPKDSLGQVKNILSAIALEKEQVAKILYCVEHHEDYNWNNPENREIDINTLILQDADNLDAIGAIGIGRTFIYDAKRAVPMYDSRIPLDFIEDFVEGKEDQTTIHHFFHKSLKLGKNMNTKTGRQLADHRIAFLQDFINEFLAEWNGEK